MVSSLETDLSYDEQMQPFASHAAKPFASLVVSGVEVLVRKNYM